MSISRKEFNMAKFLESASSIKKEVKKPKKKKQETTQQKVKSPSVSNTQRARQAQNQKMTGGYSKPQTVRRSSSGSSQPNRSQQVSQQTQRTVDRLQQKYGVGPSYNRQATRRTQPRNSTISRQGQRTVDRLTAKYGQNRIERDPREERRRQERLREAQRQKMGLNSMASKETQTAADRAIKNTPSLVKKAVKDTVSGHLQTIADITEMTASNENGTKAKAMKMGIQDNPEEMRKLEQSRKQTVEKARLDREKWAKEQDQRQQAWDKKVNGAGGAEKAYYGAVESGTGMLTDLAIGLGTQGGSLAAMFSRTYGTTRGQAQKEGATEAEDRTYSFLQAAKEVGTELMFPGVGLAKGYAKKTGLPLAERIANNLTKNIANRTAADLTGAGIRLLGGTAEENLEEFAGWGLDPIIKEFSYGRNVRTRQKMADLQAESDELKSYIRSPEDASRVGSYINSSDFIEQNKQQYMEAGLSEKKAEEVAEKMRDYMTASLTGDTKTMEALEKDIASTLSKGEFSYGKNLDKAELLDTLASTTLLTMTTGLPGTATTAMRGSVIRDNLGTDGIRTLAESAMNYEDAEASKRGEVARDRINAGKELTSSQVYELAAAQAQQVEKDTRRVVAKNNVVADTLESEKLVAPMIMRDDQGNIQGDKIITQRYNDSAQEAENVLRDIDKEQKLSLSDSELAVGSRAIAGFQTGAFTINDANALNYTNTAVRDAFEKVTGVDLGQYVVKTSSGAVDYAATNAATKDALFTMAADNFIETARAETENFKDITKGITKEQMAQRIGSEGDKAMNVALGTVDPADEDTYGLMESAAQNVYEYGRYTEDSWDDVSADLSDMYPGLSQEALHDVYEAAKRDKTIAENPYYNAKITAGESTNKMDMSEAEQTEYGKFTNETGEDIGMKERAVLESIASEFGINIRLMPSDIFKYTYVDRNGKEKTAYKNGWYDPKTGTMLLNGGNDMERNIIAVALHEITHHIAIYAPNEYLALSNRVMEAWYKNDADAFSAAIQRKQDSYKAQVGQNLSEEQALEEVIADAMGEMSSDPDFISQICTEEPSLANQIINAIRSVLRKLRAILASGDVAEEHEDAFFSQLGMWDEAQRLWLQAAKVAQQQRAEQMIDDWDANARETATEEQAEEPVSYSIDEMPDIDQLDQTNSVVEDSNGEPVAEFQDNGSVRFSISSYESKGRKIYQNYLNRMVKKGELSQQEADDMMNELETIYKISKEFADTGKFAPFTAWSNADVIYDSKGKPVFSAIKKNSEYKMNIDFSTICKKRRTLDAVFREMISRGMLERLDFNKDESAAMVVNINDLIRQHNFEAACALCFVEARRYRQQQTATTFRDMWNGLVESMYSDKSKIAYFNFGEDNTIEDVPDGIHTMDSKDLDLTHLKEIANAKKEDGKPVNTAEAKAARLLLKDPSQRKLMRIGDMMASTGFENMQIQNPKLMKIYNAKKGTGGAKSSFGDVQYLNEIINSKSFDRRKAYAVSGVRIQSFSDYVPRMVFDYVQVIADLAAKKLPAHAYTKEVLFARQFGLTGAKINLSLVPDVVPDGVAPGLDANGNYIWNEEGTFPYDEAMELQQAEGYKDNCGTIAVGISDEQIRKMLADPTIQMVIPYHKSSLNPIVAAMTNVDRFTNYEDSQNTKDENGKALSKDFDWDNKLFELSHDKDGNMLPKSEWGNVQDLVKEYADWCNDHNYTPKFSQFLYMEDGSINPGYYKLLEDFALLDNDGNFKPQGDVQMRFPTESDAFGSMASLIEQGLTEDTELEAKRSAEIGDIVDEIQTMIDQGTLAEQTTTSEKLAKRFSITPEMDEEYNKATRHPIDWDRAQELVDDAARLAGYTPVKMFHGSLSEEFTEFRNPSDNIRAKYGDYEKRSGFIYVTTDEDYALNYSSYGEPFSDDYEEGFVLEGYINVQNTLDLGDSVDRYAFEKQNDSLLDPEEQDKRASKDLRDVASAVNMTPSELLKYLGEDPRMVGDVWAIVNTQKFAELVKEMGYDSIHTIEYGANCYGLLDPTQIKSSDAITYDEDGSPIPLSERFNPDNDDIRYSLPTQDSDGNVLSDGQMEYFKNSQARDAEGKLKVVYHTTNRGGFTIFDPSYSDDHRSLFFSDSFEVSQTYGDDRTDSRFNTESFEAVDANQAAIDEMKKDVQAIVRRIQIKGIGNKEIDGETSGTGYDIYVDAEAKDENGEWHSIKEKRTINVDPDLIDKAESIEDLDVAMEELKGDAMSVASDMLGVDIQYLWDVDEVGSGWGLDMDYTPEEGIDAVDTDGSRAALEDYGYDPAAYKGYYAVYLNLVNPLVIEGRGNNWDNLSNTALGIVDREWEMYTDEDTGEQKISYVDNWGESVDVSYADAKEMLGDRLLDKLETRWFENDYGTIMTKWDTINNILGYRSKTRDIAEYAYDNGYDGVILRNISDVNKRIANPFSDIYIAFSSKQVKDVQNTDPTNNPDIRYSISDDEEAQSKMAYDDAMDTSYEALAYYETLMDEPEEQIEHYAESFSEEKINDFYAGLNSYSEYFVFDDPVLEEGRKRMARSRADFMERLNAEWNERWLTDGEVLDLRSVRKDVRQLVMGVMKNSDTSKQYKTETVNKTLIDIRLAYQFAKKGRIEVADALLWHSAMRMIEDVEFINDETFNNYKDLRDYLRTTKIQLGDEYWSDVDYAAFRKANYGRMKLVKGETNVDQIYQEMCERWPEWFDEEEDMTPPDQLLQIEHVLDVIQPYKEAYSSEEAASIARDIAYDLSDIVYGKGKPYESIADKYKNRYDKQTKALKQRHKEALRKVKEQRDKGIKAERAKWQVKEQRRKERQAHKKAFDSIVKNYNWLSERLLTNTKDKHIPEQYKKELAGLLAAFDLQTVGSKKVEERRGQKGKKTIKMEAMKKAISNIEARSEFFHLNDSITDIIDELLGREGDGSYNEAMSIEGKTIDELSVDELKKIDKLLKALKHEFTFYETVRTGAKRTQAADIGTAQVDSALKHAELFGPGKDYNNFLGAVDKIVNMDEMTPAYLFKRIDPKNTGLGMMFRELRRSFDKYVKNQEQLNGWMEEILSPYHSGGKAWKKYGAEEIENWRLAKATNTFKLQNGDEVRLTPAQMMSLYCLSKRPQAYQHMVGAGIVVKPVSFQAKLETDLKRKTNWALPTILTDGDIKMICTSLTPDQKKVADQLQQLMATKMAAWGNEASRAVIGIDLFEDPDYFPIQSDKAALEEDFTADQFVDMIRNFGFTKAVQPGARNAIAIDDIFTVVSTHCNNMNLYNAYSESMNDFMKVYNYHALREDGSDYSVKQAVAHAYSQKATTFISTFMRDLNGNVSKGRVTGIDNMMNAALGNAKKASVFANGRVALQQPTAIMRAFAVISPKYLKGVNLLDVVKGITPKVKKEAMQEMFEHCPIALWKSWGYYDINMGKSIEDIMMNNGNWLEDKMTDIYGAADNVTWTAIWQMCKAEIRDKHPNVKEGSDEFWDLCNERMTEVVDLTQVVDSPFHRSHAMRDKQILVKMATSFMAEPTLTFNMVRDGFVNAIEMYKTGDKAGAAKLVGKTSRVFVLSAFATAAMAAVWDAVRGKQPDGDDDDDDGTAIGLWWANTLANFEDNLKLWNNIYYIKDISSLFDGWGTSNLALQGWKQFADGYAQLTGAYTVKSNKSWWENMLAGIGYLTGTPFGTILKDGKAVLNIFGVHPAFLSDIGDRLDSVQDMLGGSSAGSGTGKTSSNNSSNNKKSGSDESDKVSSAVRLWTYNDAPFRVQDGSIVDNFLNHFGVNLTSAEIAAAEAAQAQKEHEKTVEKLRNSLSEYSGAEYDKKLWDKSELSGYGKALSEGDFERAEEIEQLFIDAGGSRDFLNDKKLYHYKKNWAKTIIYDPTDEQIEQQTRMKEFMLLHGVTEEELSEKAYKSQTCKELKVAFRLNDEDAMVEELVPLIRAGLSYEDFEKAYKNRNRIDLKKYKESDGKYAERLKSTGVYNWPINGQITSNFGYRHSPGGIGSTNHQGLDIAGNMGDPVAAADGGVVIMAGWYGGAGKTVQIQHDDGTVTQYSHLSWWDCNVGDTVAQGQTIGNVGSTGNSTGPHLHFGVMVNGSYVDPLTYLN